jgi:hypothetical protein
MFRHPLNHHSFEVLESRIAPAAVIDGVFKAGQVGARIELTAGEGLSTGGDLGGAYLLFVEKGRCLVITTDLNNNGQIDFNEITGIAAGDGLRLIAFADIHGDIVTNLKPDGFLSDSDSNAANDPPALGGDGRVLLNSRIEKIELRSLTAADIRDVNNDGVVDEDDLATRLVLSSYSIYGNIYAGGGFGAPDGGLLIDSTGLELQEFVYDSVNDADLFIDGVKPSIGSIKIGTAGSGDYFSFGASRADNIQGFIVPFVPKPGAPGGDIINIRAATTTMQFNIGSLEAGDGGTGARGGNIVDVALRGDDAGGYRVVAGDGGRGPTGGAGGSIVNFNDTGSVTSFVLLESGSGGEGLTARGGDGGTITLGQFTVAGNVNIILGNGGTGFTGGGNGASFPKGVLVAPPGPQPVTGAVVSSWHDWDGFNGGAGTLTSYASVDFDLDGVGDLVFASADPGQLVVQFGDPFLGFRNTVDENGIARFDRIYLDGFTETEALTVGDFNGDGHPDIATGSFSQAAFSGVRTFISLYSDTDGDGIGDTFAGFSRAIESPLPSLFTFNNALTLGVFRSATPITDIAVGDFDGDLVTDIVLTATYRDLIDTSTGQVIVFMHGDAEAGATGGTGSFYADFGTKQDNSTNPPTPANYFTPTLFLGDNFTRATLESFRLSTVDNHDVAGVSLNGRRNVVIFDNYFGGAGGSILGPLGTVVPLGNVDVDRDNNQTNSVPATHRDFTAVDYDADGDIDLAVVLQDPSAFMVTLSQGAGGTFTINSGTGDNAGIRLGSNGLDIGETFVSIRVADSNGNGGYNEVALLNYSSNQIYWNVNQLTITTGSNGATPGPGFASIFNTGGRSEEFFSFDLYPTATNSKYIVGVNPGGNHPGLHEFASPPPLLFPQPYTEYSLNIVAGDGGGSLIGKGGIGGSLGSGITGTTPDPLNPSFVDPKGTLFITFSPTRALAAENNLIAGAGGNGFSAGGQGGSINGVTSRETGGGGDDILTAHAGDGGFGVSGPGGNGGDVKAVSLERGITVTAGNGGRGKTGGAGGSILGNRIANAFDAETPGIDLAAGNGGIGIKRGGNGGGILNFVMRLQILDDGPSGPLTMVGGHGGNAISGRGGDGGSVVNSSPLDDENGLGLEIFVQSGNGGNGVSGGNGGNISKFVDRPTTADIPTILSFIAGTGGSGTTGRGGNGGSLNDIATPSVGEQPPPIGVPPPGFPPSSPVTFNRFLAGEGGASSGNTGGNGGNITGLNVSASSGAMAVAAGAGGSGLHQGGKGGSVLGSTVASGGPETGGKVLVIAGAGGNASAFTANQNDSVNNEQKAFGGKVGRGGNGGDIIGFVQENSIDVSVDLIAGNGGDTINYGTSFDLKTFVGKGGSIKNINVKGSIGNIDPLRKVKAYNDTIPDEGDSVTDISMTQWVNDFLRNPVVGSGLGDGNGNVGIVAGAAGRVKAIATGSGFETQPAHNAAKLNGSVQNLTARLLMSAVAGDVNRIAAIHAAKNINILSGLVGADKDNAGVLDTIDYLDLEGQVVQTPVLGGALLDGAFISDNRVPEIDGKPRVFIL